PPLQGRPPHGPRALRLASESELSWCHRHFGLPLGRPSRRAALRGLRRTEMALLGNLIWFVFLGGFWLWAGWVIAGCVMYVTIIGIPFGVACFRIAGVAAFPFGKEIVEAELLGETRVWGTTLA